jgi:hypothetical protein
MASTDTAPPVADLVPRAAWPEHEERFAVFTEINALGNGCERGSGGLARAAPEKRARWYVSG